MISLQVKRPLEISTVHSREKMSWKESLGAVPLDTSLCGSVFLLSVMKCWNQPGRIVVFAIVQPARPNAEPWEALRRPAQCAAQYLERRQRVSAHLSRRETHPTRRRRNGSSGKSDLGSFPGRASTRIETWTSLGLRDFLQLEGASHGLSGL